VTKFGNPKVDDIKDVIAKTNRTREAQISAEFSGTTGFADEKSGKGDSVEASGHILGGLFMLSSAGVSPGR
jgi:hypothetical protein